MLNTIITVAIVAVVLVILSMVVFLQYRRVLRQAKNYERGLKMIPMCIHIPPAGEDIESNGRDERDLVDEVISKAQVMYDVISSTIQKGFKSKVYGQRHLSFEIIAQGGLIHYYAVVPAVLTEIVKQAIASAYPSARVEEVEGKNIFSNTGKISGTVGGEFTLKKEYAYPISTYQESKRDATRALLNALSTISKEDGVAVQFMIRPAKTGWTKNAIAEAERIKKEKGEKKAGIGSMFSPKEFLTALSKPPEYSGAKPEDKQLSSIEQSTVDSIEAKTRYPGYETLIRLVVSSDTQVKAQVLLRNIISAFSLFDSATNNGFKFTPAKDVEELVTSSIFRFFPQSIDKNILNTVELSTIFHLPDQDNIPTAQVERQMDKQVDGPVQAMDEGFRIGFNEFRGVKKDIRVSTNDRRRHMYFIGQTGTGKSVLLENLAYQDMMEGRGFAFIDPHGDSAETLLGMVPKERVEDVIYFDPGDMSNPIGMNMFEFDTPDQKDFLIQEAINMLYSLYDPTHQGIVGPRLEHIFRNCALLLMSAPGGGTFIDVPKVLVDEEFRNSKLKYVTDPTVLDFWTKEFPASQKSNEAGEVITWVVAKFGPFLSNDAMRNIIGQTKSGLNLRDIMDNRKILLVNLSKGRMGDFNSKLLGIIFVMKFQAASMSRANIPEDDRVDFSLYVDEFQNFATESFETIMSEARKYRLSLILANQFMTQLTDGIREAIIGNIGTIISGRLGITDAEFMEKRFRPVFDVDDLATLPNYKTIASVLIKGVPSSAFNMSLVPPMSKSNQQLQDAIKKLSGAKYGRPRAQVEKEIAERLGSIKSVGGASQPKAVSAVSAPAVGVVAGASAPGVTASGPSKNNSSFLDEWLAKRKVQKNTSDAGSVGSASGNSHPLVPPLKPDSPVSSAAITAHEVREATSSEQGLSEKQEDSPSDLLSRGSDEEVSVNIR